MKCIDFQKEFSVWVDAGMTGNLSDDAAHHGETCTACADYAEQFLDFVRIVAEQTPIDVPTGYEDIGDVVLLMEHGRVKPGDFKEDFLTATKFLLKALLAWVILLLLSYHAAFALQMLAIAGAIYVVILRLIPRFSGNGIWA
jgi:hypothetical protein